MSTTELQRQHAHVMELRRRFAEPTKTIRRADYDAMATELRTTIAALEKAERDVEWTKRLLDDARSKIRRLEGELEAIDLIGVPRNELQPIYDIIIRVLAKFPGITWEDIKSHRRGVELLKARFILIATVHLERKELSYPVLGRIFDRHYSTIMYAVEVAKERGWV